MTITIRQYNRRIDVALTMMGDGCATVQYGRVEAASGVQRATISFNILLLGALALETAIPFQCSMEAHGCPYDVFIPLHGPWPSRQTPGHQLLVPKACRRLRMEILPDSALALPSTAITLLVTAAV